jgi:DNA-binding CsgD family transcriptional regulator
MAEQPSEAARLAFLVFTDRNERRHVRTIDAQSSPITIGREPGADISLPWDERVSRSHARLEMVGEDPAADWTLVDDGSSRNGSFVNGRRVRGRVRLSDGDTMSFGSTLVVFRAPGGEQPTADAPAEPAQQVESSDTMMLSIAVSRAALSDSQYRVLAALAKPCLRPSAPGPPATNEQIARQLFLGTDTVEGHLQELYRKFGVEALDPDERRARVVERARQLGILGGQPSERPY